ncbi:Protein of unknown function [Cotesia congregata]|uniref:Uncharacterized protein n=1 Tax=Cotesia congregata TaxID=51543 RepID=A0A8J2HAV0_COTCN|nr:Protein of unknown function [Cotesia congregata]
MRHDGAVIINHGQMQRVVQPVGIQEHIAAARPADVVPGNMVPVAVRAVPARVFENLEIEEPVNMNRDDGEAGYMNPGVEEPVNINPGEGEPVNMNRDDGEAGDMNPGDEEPVNINPENAEADDMNFGGEEADDMNPGDEPVARQPVALNHSRARRLINKINRDSSSSTAHGLICTIRFNEALSYIIKSCHHASIGKQCALQLLKNFVEKREAFLLCPYCRARVTSIDILYFTL